MGLLGLLVTLLIMILGVGYLLFDSPEESFTIENPSSSQNSAENGLSTGMAAIDAAQEVSQQVMENSRQAAEAVIVNDQPSAAEASNGQAGNNQQSTSSSIENPRSKIVNRLVSFGFERSSGRSIDTVVLHSSYNNQGGDEYSVDKVIGIWKSYGVAPHYLVDRKGNVYRLVEDGNIAYHAGVAELPDGRTNVNEVSIGIEILNGTDDECTDGQYEAVNGLVDSLKGKYEIKYVLGHSDIAPGRKTDPWNFDWEKIRR